MSGGETEARLREVVASAVRRVPGVAFPASGIGGLLRGGQRPVGGRSSGGVRVTALPGGGFGIRVAVAVRRGHRALEVTRAVRRAVTAAVGDEAPGGPLGVTVTVTSVG
ncbi:Asp23/Gls24 family envelope stress response protein [Streptomyces profundus]|uniref:Asp23/Gls24 family envelope stress response protein n=1 Tax=Streptomyces profundus TaxID=2867410 RepID=UPI001D16ED10|nr:Asp23/Gls24 family envelope stress response protein [Streptomyces sp. MA3_2.13]UED83851.1 Asp23/Gls24 family envelope stress response protein [Streptomyces sp. MA3_2.13]